MRSRRWQWIVGVVATGMLCSAALAADAPAQPQGAIDKGLEFLKSQQKPDGGWQGPQDPPAITAIVLRCFATEPRYGPQHDVVKKGYEKLLSYQLEDGGIYKDVLASYNTAIAVSALAASQDPSHRQRMEKAVAYLKALQWTDKIQGLPKGEQIDPKSPNYGGWGYGSRGRPDGSNTQLALQALHDAGVKPDDPAFEAARKFLTRQQNNSETNDQAWSGNDGGLVYTPAGGKPGAPGESFAGEYTGPDGRRMLRSYGSMTYAGLKSMIYAGLAKDEPRVKRAWDWITRNWTLEENPGMRVGDPEKAQHGLFYYYMTLARALRAYGEPVITDPAGKKHDWRMELVAKLASLQKPDGSWVGEKKWMEDNPVLVTAFALIAVQEAREDMKERPPK